MFPGFSPKFPYEAKKWGYCTTPIWGYWRPAAGRPRMTSPPNPSNNIAAALLAGARAAGPLPAVTNWPSLIEAADYHGLAPLLGSAIHPCPDEISEDDAARLRCAYRDSARRGLFLTTRLLLLLGRFEDAGISVIPLKGPVLAEMLYPDPALRPFSDLDLLVHAPDVPAALRVLASEGYQLAPHLACLPLRELLELDGDLILRAERFGQADLQWQTAPPDYPFRFDTEVLWRSVRTVGLAGRDVPALSPECLMLFLCTHGAKHMWSRLMWLGDVGRLAQAGVDWTAVMKLASETRCERPVLLGLLLAHDLLDAPVPENVLERASVERVVTVHAERVAERLYRAEPCEPSSWELTAFNASLAERPWQKIRHYAARLKAPTEAELEWIALPSHLFFLYYPLRAGRLLWKYLASKPPGYTGESHDDR